MKLTDWTFYENTFQEWLTGLVILVVVLSVLRLVKGVLTRRLASLAQKTRTTIDDVLAELSAKTKFFFLATISIYAGSLALDLPPGVHDALEKTLVLVTLFQAAFWGTHVVSYLVHHYVQLEAQEEPGAATSSTALIFLGRLVLWSLLVMVALDNLGFDITALVTGLGIGGIAVALAIQNILGDLFASLSILLDKPFVVGDFVIVDQHLGSVEHIGLKTTRLRSLSGEQLIFSNSDLLSSRIRNFKRMYERRVVFSFGVTYQTPHEKLAAIPQMVQEIVEAQEPIRFDRAHFKEYGDSSLNFEVVYWVQKPDYNIYMNIQQKINLELYRRFQEEKIEFAYPTRTIFVSQESSPA